MKKSYSIRDLIRQDFKAEFFYRLSSTKEPTTKSSYFERISYRIKIKSAGMYLKYLDLQNLYVFYFTRYYPFSTMFKGNLFHNDFKIERKIIGYFELMGYADKIYMSIKSFNSDKAYVYYVGFFNFKVDLEKEIEKLQIIMQKIDQDFYVREYKNGWFKIMIPWNKYLELRKEYGG